MSTVTGTVAYVIKNVFSRVRNTDNDMSSRSVAGKLFHMVRPLTVKTAVTVVSRHAWMQQSVDDTDRCVMRLACSQLLYISSQ